MLAVFIIIIFLLVLLLLLLLYSYYFFLPELILRIAGKIENIRTRKNVPPLGSLIMLLPWLNGT